MTFRWIDGPSATDEEWQAIGAVFAERGWPEPDRDTTRVRVAEDDGGIAGFLCLRLHPHVEPMWVSRRTYGTGLAEELADQVIASLTDAGVSGYMVVAENPIAARLCEERGFERVRHPVYVKTAVVAAKEV